MTRGRPGWLPVWIMALAAVALAAYSTTRVLCRTPLTTDEHSYIFQANTFLDGKLTRPCPPFTGFFHHKMIIAEKEVGWVSRYPPGHVLFLLPGAWLGDHHLSVMAGAGLALLLIAWAAALAGMGDARTAGARPDRTAAVMAGLLLLASPWFVFTYGTLLAHTSGMLATAALLAGYLVWRRYGRTLPALLAGLAWGWLCLNRTYTALLVALPFGLDALWLLWRRRDMRTLRGVLFFAGAAAAGVAALLVYNQLILGNPFTMTYLYYEPLEALGFGRRHYGEHNLVKGLTILRNNLKLMDLWLWGVPGGVLLYLILFALGRPRLWLVLLAPALAVPLGYVFFFHRGPHETGPGYYFEILPFVVVGAALGLRRIWTWLPGRAARRWAALVLVLLAAAGPVRHGLGAARELRALIEPRRELLAAKAAAPADALVFMVCPGPREDRPMDYAVFNPRGLASAPLALAAADGSEIAVARYFPDRRPFRLHLARPPFLEAMDRDAPYGFSLNAANAHRLTGSNFREADDAPTWRVARAGRDKDGMLAFGNYRNICPGRFSAVFEVKTVGPADGPVAVLDVTTSGGRRVLARMEVAAGRAGPVTLDFEVDEFLVIEPRVYYKGQGELWVRSMHVMERRE
ncbi:MAG: glycosyltransferase family 39 protein [Lentisphaerae bacterium]|nr:glycosyltransferase family 39 protein [Lentisphaerota bacterium]